MTPGDEADNDETLGITDLVHEVLSSTPFSSLDFKATCRS